MTADSGIAAPRVIRRGVPPKPPTRTLVMFSGGIDSTYTLVKLLRETRDQIHVHHIHLVNVEGRHAAEAKACRDIVAWCRRNIRQFRYSESSIDHRGMPFFGWDMIATGFEAGIVAHSFQIQRWTIGTCTEEGHWEERFRHVEACCAANCFPDKPPEFFLLPMVTKREEIDYLGPELTQMCWTCRRPVKSADGFRACGTCKTCELVGQSSQSTLVSIL